MDVCVKVWNSIMNYTAVEFSLYTFIIDQGKKSKSESSSGTNEHLPAIQVWWSLNHSLKKSGEKLKP